MDAKADIKTIREHDAQFPRLLAEIPHPPKTLYTIGNEALMDKPCIAIIGTRKATDTGETLACEFAEYFASHGIVVVSGLAVGIDASAHKGALAAHGKTIAVLGNGLHEIYPQQNEKLAREILQNGGLLISEYPPGTPALPHQFLERNRIVSGLSKGVVVIEAPEKSGALSTAAHALEQNREVFVVPGPAKHPNYKGGHRLIKSGACLVSTPEEVLEELNIIEHNSSSKSKNLISTQGMNTDEIKIIEIIQNAGKAIEVDKICELTRIEARTVARVLGILTLQGIVREENGKYLL